VEDNRSLEHMLVEHLVSSNLSKLDAYMLSLQSFVCLKQILNILFFAGPISLTPNFFCHVAYGLSQVSVIFFLLIARNTI
jgi:hypothetical protein